MPRHDGPRLEAGCHHRLVIARLARRDVPLDEPAALLGDDEGPIAVAPDRVTRILTTASATRASSMSTAADRSGVSVGLVPSIEIVTANARTVSEKALETAIGPISFTRPGNTCSG